MKGDGDYPSTARSDWAMRKPLSEWVLEYFAENPPWAGNRELSLWLDARRKPRSGSGTYNVLSQLLREMVSAGSLVRKKQEHLGDSILMYAYVYALPKDSDEKVLDAREGMLSNEEWVRRYFLENEGWSTNGQVRDWLDGKRGYPTYGPMSTLISMWRKGELERRPWKGTFRGGRRTSYEYRPAGRS